MRGYAVRVLQQRVRGGDRLTPPQASAVLQVLLPLLSDPESFVYLCALMALRDLAEHQPRPVVEALLGVYRGERGRESGDVGAQSSHLS